MRTNPQIIGGYDNISLELSRQFFNSITNSVIKVKILEAELTMLQNEVDKMRNLTLRMSDDYLDLDLLDEQARDILGQIRSDEVIIQ